MPEEAVRAQLEAGGGTLFDAGLVHAFFAVLDSAATLDLRLAALGRG
jgi:hypothetical protein